MFIMKVKFSGFTQLHLMMIRMYQILPFHTTMQTNIMIYRTVNILELCTNRIEDFSILHILIEDH